MKSYTDLEQSKKLAEILPLESADMCWTSFDEKWDAYLGSPNSDAIKKEIPCWSLAALLEQLNDEITDDNGKVVFAHRPPEYWDGKNIITNEVTRYEPKRYDKGGWNLPDVKWWLDLDLPKIEE